MTHNNFGYNPIGSSVFVGSFSSPRFGDTQIPGNNYFHHSCDGIYVCFNASPILGADDYFGVFGGSNIIEENDRWNVIGIYDTEIMALYNWWGSSDQSYIENKFYCPDDYTYGSNHIEYYPWLYERPGFDFISSSPLLFADAGSNLSENTISMVSLSNRVNASNSKSVSTQKEINDNMPIKTKLKILQKDFLSRNYSRVKSICKDIIDKHPDSSSAVYALNLLWQAYRETEVDSFKIFLYDLLNKNKSRKDVYAAAGLILAGYAGENKVNAIKDLLKKYEGYKIEEQIFFDLIFIELFDQGDAESARNTLKEMEEKFPKSELVEKAKQFLAPIKGKNILKRTGLDSVNNFKKEIIIQEDNSGSESAIPGDYNLLDNYPNPFNPVTNIIYHLPKAGFVMLKIYDILGNEVATLVNEVKKEGIHSVQFNASSLASGVYIYTLNAGDFISSKKMILAK